LPWTDELNFKVNIAALPFFQHVKWRPNANDLRQFAVAMLVGFSLLGLIAAWRAKEIGNSSIILWGIGVSLAIAAFIPKLGRVAYLVVYVPTSIMGYVMSNIALALMFFLVITPLGLLLRFMRKDVLKQHSKQNAAWTPVKSEKTKDSYYRQF
jgi:hypothetical protein